MKKMKRYELHLDPPLNDPRITKENHEFLELFFLAPEHIGEWFLSLPHVTDRTVVSFTDAKYPPSVYRDEIVVLLRECAKNNPNIPDDIREVMRVLGVEGE